MLKPNVDRINYSQSLIPPEGYELRYAICTTYSLNMETIISVLLALGYEISSPETSTNSEAIAAFLNIIEKLCNKVLFFCETGKIDIPNINHNLHILLERMIVPVALKSKNNYYPAFHPKTWILKFVPKDKGEAIYRTIVLSRNLTYDKSLDISICFDGKKTNTLIEKANPFYKLFNLLLEHTTKVNSQNKSILLEALEDIQYVDFKSEGCLDYSFILNGVDDEDIKEDELFSSEKNINRLFVMSPFINNGFFEGININKQCEDEKPNILIARRNEAYQNVSEELFDCFDVYDLKQIADIENTQTESNTNHESDINKYNGFHAKIMGTYDGRNTSIYMGSMNATTAARDYNVEMMVRLDYEGNKLDEVIDELIPIDEKKCIFEQIFYQELRETDEQKEDRNAEKMLKGICRLNLQAELIEGEGKLKVRILRNKNSNEDIFNFTNDFFVKIQSITTKEEQAFSLHKDPANYIEFTYEYPYEVSELFRIKICNYENKEIKSGIINIHVKGLNVLSRQKELINNILQDSSILFNSLQMIFERNNSSFFEELLNPEDEYGERNSNNKKYSVSELEIYEKILKSCCNDYNSILDFIRLLDKVEISKLENGNSLISLKKSLIDFDKVTKNEYNKLQTK